MPCINKKTRSYRNMAPKKSTIALNIEQFIRDVEQRPAIWNRNFHCNKAFLEQMWDELSTEHKLPKVVLKAKWKGLRDNFRVEYKRIPRSDTGELMIEPVTFESKWIHYYALLFLIEHMRHRTPKNEQDQAYLLTQQSSDTIEKTIVEPDLTNGLISRLQDSDEDYDENDVDEDDIDDEKQAQLIIKTIDETTTSSATKTLTNAMENYVPVTSTAALMALQQNVNTPPVAHSHSLFSSATQLLIKSDEVARSLLKSTCLLQLPHGITEPPQAHSGSQASTSIYDECVEHTEPEDLSTNSGLYVYNCFHKTSLQNQQTSNEITNLTTATAVSKDNNNMQQPQQQQQVIKKRAISPPPQNTITSSVTDANEGGCMNGKKDSDLDKLETWKSRNTKRPHVPEEQSTNSIPAAKTVTLVPEDDDYHYLLSLHPYMKQLTAAQKLRTRTKIQKLIFKELFKENLDRSEN